ncbi:hypothetical protein OQA88_11770 [Cercophora sp. LCS_1]
MSSSVDRFCWQYLQLDSNLDFPDGACLRDAKTQELLYSRLFAEDKAVRLPPPRYQLRVLKEVLKRVESSIEDWDEHGISDNLTTSLAHLLSLPLLPEAAAAQQKCYVTYHLSLLEKDGAPDPHITLLESRSLIAASGTTGLRTWEAALHLGQYLCVNPDLVKHQNVLELGAGTGYLGILCAKYLEAESVIVSDGSDEVINNLPESFYLNDLQGTDKVTPMDLKWGHALVGTEDAVWNRGRQVNTVLGADITYDASVIPALVATLEELVALFPKVRVVIAATERNEATFRSFLDVCAKRGFAVTTADFAVPSRKEQTGPFYNDQSPIHICELRYLQS